MYINIYIYIIYTHTHIYIFKYAHVRVCTDLCIFWAPARKKKKDITGPKAMPKDGAQNGDQNWTQIETPKTFRGPRFARRREQRRVEDMIFIQWSAQ